MTDWVEHWLAAKKRMDNINARATLQHWEAAEEECAQLRVLATDMLVAVRRMGIEQRTREANRGGE